MLRLACHSRQAPCARNSRPANEPSDRAPAVPHEGRPLKSYFPPCKPRPSTTSARPWPVGCAMYHPGLLRQAGPPGSGVCGGQPARETQHRDATRSVSSHTHTCLYATQRGPPPTLELPSAQYRPPPLGRLRGSFPWHGRAWPTCQREKTVLAATCAVQPATTPASSRLTHEHRVRLCPYSPTVDPTLCGHRSIEPSSAELRGLRATAGKEP